MKKVENRTPDQEKKRRKIFYSLIVAACVIYVFASAQPLSQEIHFVPAWTIDVDKNSRNERILERLSQEDGAAKLFEESIPYKLGQTAGYFTKNGTVLSYKSFPYKATISQNLYTLYGTHSSNISVFDRMGSELFKIKQTGFPYFSGDNIFLFLPAAR